MLRGFAFDSILFVFDRKPDRETWRDPAGSIISLAEVVTIEDGDLVLDHVELKRIMNKKQSTVQPFSKPPGATWDNVVMRLVPSKDENDENPQVQIQIGRRSETRSFIDMGMVDGRRQPPEPNSAWHLMLLIAKAGGQLTWNDAGAGTNARAHMKLLRRNLRAVFLLDDDPFKNYKPGTGWEVRFILTDLRNAP